MALPLRRSPIATILTLPEENDRNSVKSNIVSTPSVQRHSAELTQKLSRRRLL